MKVGESHEECDFLFGRTVFCDADHALIKNSLYQNQ